MSEYYLNKVTVDRLIFFAKICEFIFACIEHNFPNLRKNLRKQHSNMLSAYFKKHNTNRIDWDDTLEKRSAHACLPCFRREFACAFPNRNYTRYQNKLDSGREIQKSKLHTQKISLEFHEHKVY